MNLEIKLAVQCRGTNRLSAAGGGSRHARQILSQSPCHTTYSPQFYHTRSSLREGRVMGEIKCCSAQGLPTLRPPCNSAVEDILEPLHCRIQVLALRPASLRPQGRQGNGAGITRCPSASPPESPSRYAVAPPRTITGWAWKR